MSDAIIWASDGPVLILADGSVVRPRLWDSNGEKMTPWSVTSESGGGAIYGPEVDEDHTRIDFEHERDPSEIEIEAVREYLDAIDAKLECGSGGEP